MTCGWPKSGEIYECCICTTMPLQLTKVPGYYYIISSSIHYEVFRCYYFELGLEFEVCLLTYFRTYWHRIFKSFFLMVRSISFKKGKVFYFSIFKSCSTLVFGEREHELLKAKYNHLGCLSQKYNKTDKVWSYFLPSSSQKGY